MGAVFKIIHSGFTRAQWKIRCWVLNKKRGVYVSPNAYIAKSAALQLKPDGLALGGSIYISKGVRISDGVILAPYGGSIFIGENVFIGPYSVLYGHGGLRIEHDTLIASHTVIIPCNHRFTELETAINKQGEIKKGIIIGADVWIGCGVQILDGVNIESKCVIGAGSVVNKSLQSCSIAVGVPARVIRNRADAPISSLLEELSKPHELSVSNHEELGA